MMTDMNRFRPTLVITDDILEALHEAYEYFDQRSDADHNGHRFVANKEMKLASAFQAMLCDIEGDRDDGREEAEMTAAISKDQP